MPRYLHLFHFLLASIWVGTHIANDALAWTLERSRDRAERARTSRFLLTYLEMPLAILVPLLGFALSGVLPFYWKQGWFHVKLTAFVLLWLLLALAVRRNRLLVRALEAGDDVVAAHHWHGYLVLRILAVLAFVVIFIALVFRIGIPRPL